MSYFQCQGVFTEGSEVFLQGETARHMRDARRVRVGEHIVVQDAHIGRFTAQVLSTEKAGVALRLLARIPLPPPPRHSVTLLHALIAEQSMDVVIQKTTELGAEHIVFFYATHSPHRIPPNRLPHKRARWEAIMRAACEQSERPTPPTLHVCTSLDEALMHIPQQSVLYLLDVSGTKAPSQGESSRTLLVGPEGGFTDEEKTVLLSRGAHTLSLGSYVLRADTAAIAGTAMLVQ